MSGVSLAAGKNQVELVSRRREASINNQIEINNVYYV
jgi:hypothetical protein